MILNHFVVIGNQMNQNYVKRIVKNRKGLLNKLFVGGFSSLFLFNLFALHKQIAKKTHESVPFKRKTPILSNPADSVRMRDDDCNFVDIHKWYYLTSNFTVEENMQFLTCFFNELRLRFSLLKRMKLFTHEDIWKTYHDLVNDVLYPWDRAYLNRFPEVKKDNSMFLSIVSFRDEHCFETLMNAYEKARNPENIYVGIVQQNCMEACKSGMQRNHKVKSVGPDENCYTLFCESAIGRRYCRSRQIRVLNVNETEALGPYNARFFASKLWAGEQWFMQIDSHMSFSYDWDATAVEMLQKAPSKKPVISHYPPSIDMRDIKKEPRRTAPPRLCRATFSSSGEMIRFEGNGLELKEIDIPRFAPFVAGGFFVAPSVFLREVPFDPFLPWLFEGEEIYTSVRLWTHGYDFFSPSQNIVGHIYIRKHKPKYWESINRVFRKGIFAPLHNIVLDRVKYQLGYPEVSIERLIDKTILTAVDYYSIGKNRSLYDYYNFVGLDVISKKVSANEWCHYGKIPKGFEEFSHLYQ